MTELIDRAIGERTYLNAGQLLFALPRREGMSRVRVQFRRLNTTPGYWSEKPEDGGQETCRVKLDRGGCADLFRFIPRPDLPLLRGAPEAPCEVRVTSLKSGPVIPVSAEAEFEGALWTSTIRLAKLIGPPPGSDHVWLPVCVDGSPELLDPTPHSGLISLKHVRDRMGVHLLHIRINGMNLMEFGVTVARLK